jgi:transposase
MTRHTDSVEVVLKDQRRRRCSPAEKAALVRRTYEPGMSVSLVERQEGGRAACRSNGENSNAKGR